MTFEEQQYQVYLSALEKDRGSIKWSMAMMIPEHVSMLKERDKRDGYIKKPHQEEWELEDMQMNLMMALNSKVELEYKIWNDGKFEFHRGVITKFNEQSREFFYSDPFMSIQGPINLDNVVGIMPLD